MTRRLRPLPILLAAVLAGLVTGCSAADGGSQSSSDSGAAHGSSLSGGASGSVEAKAAVRQADSAAAPGKLSSDQTAQDVGGTRQIRTAQVTIEVPRLPAALAQIRAQAAALGGTVSNENSQFPSGRDSGAESELTLRVPEPRLDEALTRIATVGHELKRSMTTEDVTAKITDLDSRVATQARSVARIRDLMNRAKSLKDVVLLESELSQRQADLESIQAQQRVLSNQADLATITVSLRTPAAVVAARHHVSGFVSGFRSGWHGVSASLAVLVTLLGLLLPPVLVLAVVAGLGYLLYRRFRPGRRRPAPDPTS